MLFKARRKICQARITPFHAILLLNGSLLHHALSGHHDCKGNYPNTFKSSRFMINLQGSNHRSQMLRIPLLLDKHKHDRVEPVIAHEYSLVVANEA
jgi:hypothetical protein